MGSSVTTYSKKIAGSEGNFNWPVRFDKTEGFVGISQFEGKRVNGRVLLSPNQVAELVAFAKRRSTSAGE